MIDIKKTYKNYVDGKYVRSESGKTYTKELKNEFYELPLTSKKDIRDAIFALNNSFDWIALSFVRSKKDILELKQLISDNCDHHIPIISKIEKPEAIKKMDEIIKVSNGGDFEIDNFPAFLFSDNKQITQCIINLKAQEDTIITMKFPAEKFNSKLYLQINDDSYQFDNKLFFSTKDV